LSKRHQRLSCCARRAFCLQTRKALSVLNFSSFRIVLAFQIWIPSSLMRVYKIVLPLSVDMNTHRVRSRENDDLVAGLISPSDERCRLWSCTTLMTFASRLPSHDTCMLTHSSKLNLHIHTATPSSVLGRRTRLVSSARLCA
jgi:hypothetical protein